MATTRFFRRLGVLFFAFAFIIQAAPANAGMISTEQTLPQNSGHTERDRVRALTERADVQRLLQAQGIESDSAKARVDAMTDAEVSALSEQIDALPAGGALSQTDWILILLIAILVAIAL
jgi:hypothetical protein